MIYLIISSLIIKSLNFSEKCMGLNPEWTSTIETTTQFPVDPGTVVEVTCTDADAVNKGSSEITCTSHTEFSHDKEPDCVIQGISHHSGSYLI